MQDAGRVDRPSQHIPVNNAVDAIRVRPYVWNMPGRRHRNQHETLAALRNTDPKGQLHRAWQLRELLRTLLRHPLEQARGELKHWVFWASHSRIPEITELARKIRRRRPDILRTIELGYSNARLEVSDNRIKVTIRMAYGFHHANSLIALVMLRCAGNHGASDNRDTPLLTYRRSMVL